MKIERLKELKQKLTNEADLSNIWLFYMDHFADYPEFTELGDPQNLSANVWQENNDY